MLSEPQQMCIYKTLVHKEYRVFQFHLKHDEEGLS